VVVTKLKYLNRTAVGYGNWPGKPLWRFNQRRGA